ncbi:MAG: hypothetical protein P1V51_02835 [Deltaproteobacteria bacterium]|nr:hypothetical protein [Deltaproteobacteria bacterium]
MRHAPRPSLGALVIGAALAASGGAALEWVHLQAGVWSLPEGVRFPAWIAPVYFFALVALLATLPWLEGDAPRPATPALNLLISEGTSVAALVLLPALLPTAEGWLTLIVLAYLGFRLVFQREPGDRLVLGDLRLAGALLLLDALLESMLLRAGLYRYEGASLFTFPLWGPLLWAALGISIRRLAWLLPRDR